MISWLDPCYSRVGLVKVGIPKNDEQRGDAIYR